MHPHLESQDNSPNKAKCQSVIPIHNIMRSHVFQVHSLLFQELQGFINILQAMDAHPSFSWFGLEGTKEKKSMYYCSLTKNKKHGNFSPIRWVVHEAHCRPPTLHALVLHIRPPVYISRIMAAHVKSANLGLLTSQTSATYTGQPISFCFWNVLLGSFLHVFHLGTSATRSLPGRFVCLFFLSSHHIDHIFLSCSFLQYKLFHTEKDSSTKIRN